MPPPPKKRQKRLVLLDSDDEASSVDKQQQERIQIVNTPASRARSKFTNTGASKHGNLSSRTRTKERTTTTRARSDSTRWSPSSSSPERPPSNSVKVQKGAPKGSLHTFFNTARQVPFACKNPKGGTPVHQAAEAEEQEDIIEDDSPHEKLYKPPEQAQNKAVTTSQEKPITASQRFLAVGKSIAREASTQTQATLKGPDARPWAEKYGPISLEELMVHKKKVADVRGWLEAVYSQGERKRLLILRGPSGAGKTATISALAKLMDLDLSEWRNPLDLDFSSEAYTSMSARFEDFLGRSGRYGSLDFKSDTAPTLPFHDQPKALEDDKRRKLILMEEFPSTFTSTSHALRSFRSNILQYLAANTPLFAVQAKQQHDDQNAITPLIIIITETSADATTSASESFTAHRLLGPDILHHVGTSIIEFNPIAPTLLTKALDLVIQKEARDSGRRRIPGPPVLKKLGEVGDVRSAIGSLEFLCLRGSDRDDWGGRVANRSKKNAGSTLTKMEKATLELLSQREASIGLFHAVGKVVYNKREEPHSANRPYQPPSHLPQHARLKISEVSVDTLMDETGTDPRTFIAALHENYVMSCEGNDFTDSLNHCLDALSDSDMLASDRAGRLGLARGTYQGTAVDALRQDEIAFQTAVRGLLFALPYPVKRTSHPIKGAEKNAAHKMFYPTSMRLGRQTEEMESLVEQWSDRSRASAKHSENPDHDYIMSRTHSTQAELILERLPYIAKIQRSKSLHGQSPDLERITQFNGINMAADETVEDDDLTIMAKKDKALMPPPPTSGKGVKAVQDKAIELGEDVWKLYLSDDDIEDD
ncbi:hypothetical protein G7Y79_00036g072500 [Physcia stellaris]|nr:hypothetical protein G7Y79_00036g072500 [Physcia stellaris]